MYFIAGNSCLSEVDDCLRDFIRKKGSFGHIEKVPCDFSISPSETRATGKGNREARGFNLARRNSRRKHPSRPSTFTSADEPSRVASFQSRLAAQLAECYRNVKVDGEEVLFRERIG